MKKITMAIIAAFALVASVFGAKNALTPDNKVTTERIQQALGKQYNAAIRDSGGTKVVVVTNGNQLTVVVPDEVHSLVVFVWAADAKNYSAADKLALCQRMNQKYILARFYLDKDEDFRADYFMSYKGGLNEKNLLANVAHFQSVIDDFLIAVDKLTPRDAEDEDDTESKPKPEDEDKDEDEEDD